MAIVLGLTAFLGLGALAQGEEVTLSRFRMKVTATGTRTVYHVDTDAIRSRCADADGCRAIVVVEDSYMATRSARFAMSETTWNWSSDFAAPPTQQADGNNSLGTVVGAYSTYTICELGDYDSVTLDNMIGFSLAVVTSGATPAHCTLSVED